MRLMMILAFVISSITLVVMLPNPLPPPPDEVRPGPGVTHVEAITLNTERLERYQRTKRIYHVRLGGAAVAVLLVLAIGYRAGRRLG